ncbi:MAG TPA: patatin-like phospholipase RssA [Gammaproteobacteria bacterium]
MSKPKIGLSLGSGAARGWSHIGVINALEEIGITPDIVTGSSVGAVVGAAYAAGRLDAFTDWVRKLDRIGVIRLLDAKLSGGGFVQGKALLAAFEKQIGNPLIEDLAIPFGCVATELGTGREVWLREGRVLDAVRASMAMPGVFSPVKQNGQYLLDGGLVNPVPVSLTRAMGADVVIAVNLNGDLVGYDFFLHETNLPGKAGATTGKALSTTNGAPDRETGGENSSKLSQWAGDLKHRVGDRLDKYASSLRKEKSPEPGLFDVVIGAIDIMQDRITRARMAGEPPDVHITPRMREVGVMDFDRAADAIREGAAATQRERPDLDALKRALDRMPGS